MKMEVVPKGIMKMDMVSLVLSVKIIEVELVVLVLKGMKMVSLSLVEVKMVFLVDNTIGVGVGPNRGIP